MGDTDFSSCQRSVFHWIHADEKKKIKLHQTITSEEVAEQYGIPQVDLVSYIKNEIKEAEACRSLPFTLLLVMSYSIMAYAHDDAVIVRAVEDSLVFDIDDNTNFAYTGDFMGHKGMIDVNSIADFWSWMNIGFLPLLFGQEEEFSEGSQDEDGEWTHPLYAAAGDLFEVAPVSDRGYLLYYNRIVGGVRLVQERSGGEGGVVCPTKASLLSLYSMTCVEGLEYNIYPESGLPRERATLTVDPQGLEWLYVFDDYDVLQQQVWDLEAGDENGKLWLDRHTQKIEIAIPVYNAEFGVHTLIRVNFYFSRGGHIWKKIIPQSAFADWHHSWYFGFYDGIWLLCLVWIFYSETAEMTTLIRKKGILAIPLEYANIWNFIDWLTVFWGLIIISLWLGGMGMRQTMNDALVVMGNMTQDSTLNNVTRPVYELVVEEYMESLLANVDFYRIHRLAIAAYPLIIIFRLFKSFSAQPRLALVTKTIAKAGPDLFHFMIVFLSVFGTFVICGIVLFGREVESFSTVPRAIMTCLRMVLGDVDWGEVSEIGRREAAVWLWSFIIVVVLLMLNMILAIIMDNYEDVKNETGYKETLWEEAKQAVHRWRGIRNRTIVPLTEVLDAINDDDHTIEDSPAAQKARMIAAKIGTWIGFGAFLREPLNETDEALGMDEEEEAEHKAEHEKKPDHKNRVIHVEQLRQVVSMECSSGVMLKEQATNLIQGAVEDFYERNKEGAELEEVMTLTQKVNHRVKKMTETTRNAYETRDSGPVNELQWFGQELDRFLEQVVAEREANLAEVQNLKTLKHDLEERLMRCPPNILFNDETTEVPGFRRAGR